MSNNSHILSDRGMIDFHYSIIGQRSLGRWYPRPDRITIHLNKLAEIHNPETDLDNFIKHMNTIELHELAHIIGFRGGCKNCNKEKPCGFCNLTYRLFLFDAIGIWITKKELAEIDERLKREEKGLSGIPEDLLK